MSESLLNEILYFLKEMEPSNGIPTPLGREQIKNLIAKIEAELSRGSR